ncbi:retrovirus-related pol polyprotein from transposon TNT 1-94 [Tanacetum coccineum]|uniref:Retrovirus-related pol polyprotein from transposon TNT 1-94 n=1 Tax=Tanacetum coccineum TaxID=301880 RepID=A0ABQ5EHB0_9ASTR
MSNTNTNLQTQTSNGLHNAIMEVGGKGRPPMLAPYSYTEKSVPVAEGSSETTTEGYMENYKNVSLDIRNQLDAEAEVVQIILTGIDSDIYSTVNSCPNACEIWKAIERLKQGESINVQDLKTNLYWEFRKFTSRDGESLESYYSRSQQAATRNRGKAIVNSPPPTYDQEPTMVAEDDEMSKEKDINKLMDLIFLSFKKIYKPTNNNLITSSNTSRAHQDNTPRINRGIRYDNQRVLNVAGARENVEQADWRDETDDEHEDQELKAYYLYMAQIQEVTSDVVDNSRPIFDVEPLKRVQNDNDNYNVFANDGKHSEQPESVNDTYPDEQAFKKNTTSKSFEALQQHAINLEIALQQSQEQLNNDKIWKQKESNSFRELNVKYFEIQDLKAQLQDKDIAISELKKLIEKMKGKSVETKFEKPSVIRQPNAFKSQRQSVLGVIPTTSVSRPQLKSNHSKDRVFPNNSQGKKQEVEDQFSNNKMFVTVCNDSLNAKTSNVNFDCVTCRKCVLNDNHNMCVLHYINGVNSRTKMPMVMPISTREPKQTVNQSAATPLKRTIAAKSTYQKPRSIIRNQYEQISKTYKWWYYNITPPGYKWKPKFKTVNVEPNVSMLLGTKSRSTNILEPMPLRKSTVSNTPSSSNSFAARSRGTYLYSITLQDTSTPNPICLMAKATSSQAWLWHLCLSHLNLDTINLLSKYDIMAGLPKFKFVKYHLCSSCELGKAKHKSFKTKTTPNSKRRLQILHIDLCGPMRVESFNEGIEHQTSTAQSPEQNGIVERWNRTLVKAARTMLSAAKLPLYGENLDKMKEKGDECIFVGYFTQLRVYQMASDYVSSDLVPQCLTTELERASLSLAPTFTPTENIIQAETNKECAQVEEDEFINIFSTLVQKQGETSSRYVDSSNMHTFYQRHPLEHRWTKDHPLEQVIGNPSRSIRTRCQLETDGEICMFTLTMSRTEPKNIKEAMVDSAWIETMQEELHQFD